MKTSLVVIISTPAATLGHEGEDYKFKANVVCQLKSGSTWETYCSSTTTTHTHKEGWVYRSLHHVYFSSMYESLDSTYRNKE